MKKTIEYLESITTLRGFNTELSVDSIVLKQTAAACRKLYTFISSIQSCNDLTRVKAEALALQQEFESEEDKRPLNLVLQNKGRTFEIFPKGKTFRIKEITRETEFLDLKRYKSLEEAKQVVLTRCA